MKSAPKAAVVLLSALLAATASAKTNGRLDSPVTPTFQAIELNLDATKREYSGSVRIDVTVAEPTRRIEFHAEEMQIDRAELLDASGAAVSLACEIGEEGFVEATASAEIAPGEYTLEIDFSKEYNTQALGLYRVYEGGVGYLFTQFEDVEARKAFPCWDEPAYKIRWKSTVRIPEDQAIVTNTPVESEKAADGMKTVVFKETPPTPSYLLAYAAGPLESVEIEGLSVPGRIYCPKGQSHLTRLAAEIAPPTLAALEEWFDRKYPYEKLDLIAVPEYWPGAMENPGAVTYKDDIILLDYENSSVAQRRFLARATAHEFAHMWFGDLVTMSWWDDLWLNESFADWLGDKISHSLYPQFEIEVTEVQGAQGIMSRDARPSAKAIRKPVDSPDDVTEDLILAYEKGKTVLRMVEMWIGEEAFRRGVLDYIEAHAWGNTVASDLFDALSNAADEDITPVLSGFLDQPGFPLVSVDFAGKSGVVTLSQKRFLNQGVEAEAQTWTVPVQLKYSNGQDVFTRTVLLDAETKQVELGSQVKWMHPNAGAFGYYRWQAPADVMYLMAENPDILDARERATFLSNADALLDAGTFSGDEYLAVLSAFAKSPEPEAVSSVVSSLDAVEGAFVTDELEDAFAVYVEQSLRPALDRIGIEPREGEPETVKVLRSRLLGWLGMRGRDAEVRKHCEKLAAAYLEDPSSVDGTLAGVALRVSAYFGDRQYFDRVMAEFEAAEDPTARRNLLGSFGYFQEPELQDATLALVTSNKIRVNELFRVIGPILQYPAGRDRVYNWLTSNYDQIMANLPPMMGQYMPYIASGCSEERLQAARVFFGDPARSSPAAEKTLAKVSDQVMDCVNLREREGAAVAQYLEGFVSAR